MFQRLLTCDRVFGSALVLLFCLCLPSDAQQTIYFDTIVPSVIEQRLQQAQNENAGRKEALWKLFEEAGCNELGDQSVKGSRVPNVICTLAGTEDATIVVGAHFDKTGKGDGTIDNWSGASMLPSLFQSLKSRPRRFTFVFVGFTDEEKGLVGSKFFVKQLGEDQRAKLRAMVNIDSIGLSPTKIWVTRSDKKLVNAAANVAAAVKLPIAEMNADQVGDSDSTPFLSKKIPTIDFHSVTQDTFPILHSARDNISAAKMQHHYDTYRLLAAFLAYLDVALDPKPAQATE